MTNCLLPISGGENSAELGVVIADMAWRLPVTLTPLLRYGLPLILRLTLCESRIFQAYCQLCAKLHQEPPERNILTDFHSWWTKNQCKKMKFETAKDKVT